MIWLRTLLMMFMASLLIVAPCGLKGQNLVTTEFVGGAPETGNQSFNIALALSGPSSNISGLHVNLYYDSSEVLITGVSDNTGQSGAGVEFTMGPVTAGTAGGTTNSYRSFLLTTNSDLINPPNLAEVHLETTAGFTGAPILGNLIIADAVDGDGLYNESFTNISHSYASSLPVVVTEWEAQ